MSTSNCQRIFSTSIFQFYHRIGTVQGGPSEERLCVVKDEDDVLLSADSVRLTWHTDALELPYLVQAGGFVHAGV